MLLLCRFMRVGNTGLIECVKKDFEGQFLEHCFVAFRHFVRGHNLNFVGYSEDFAIFTGPFATN